MIKENVWEKKIRTFFFLKKRRRQELSFKILKKIKILLQMRQFVTKLTSNEIKI